MKRPKKKPDPLDRVIENPLALGRIEEIVNRNGSDFIREFQHYVGHEVSPNAVLDWLLTLCAHNQETTFENLCKIRNERTEVALRGQQNRGKREKRAAYLRKPKKQPTKKNKKSRWSDTTIDRLDYARPTLDSAYGISSVISIPMGGQPPPRQRRKRRR